MIAHSLRPARLSVTRPMQRAIMTGGALVATVLAAPTRTTEADVQAFRFSNDSRYLAIEKQRADTDAKHTGHDGVLRTLATGLTRNLGNVARLRFQ
ncbi:MAG: hypothetical protein ACREL7_15150 [Longimicrobiales bacterium]